MKKHVLLLTLLALFSFSFAQMDQAIELEDLNGDIVMSNEILNEEGPTIVSFWATWCKPCMKELRAIQDVYDEWQDETGVKLIAISIDDPRSATKVPGTVDSEGWEYDVYIDTNSELRRSMNVVNVPHTFLIDEDGNIVYQHTSYAPGDEDELHEKLVDLVKGE